MIDKCLVVRCRSVDKDQFARFFLLLRRRLVYELAIAIEVTHFGNAFGGIISHLQRTDVGGVKNARFNRFDQHAIPGRPARYHAVA